MSSSSQCSATRRCQQAPTRRQQRCLRRSCCSRCPPAVSTWVTQPRWVVLWRLRVHCWRCMSGAVNHVACSRVQSIQGGYYSQDQPPTIQPGKHVSVRWSMGEHVKAVRLMLAGVWLCMLSLPAGCFSVGGGAPRQRACKPGLHVHLGGLLRAGAVHREQLQGPQPVTGAAVAPVCSLAGSCSRWAPACSLLAAAAAERCG